MGGRVCVCGGGYLPENTKLVHPKPHRKLNKKQNQVNRRRQSWIDKYEKKNRSNNMMEGEIKLNNNRRHNNDDKMQKKQMPSSVLTPPPPPPPPPPITIEM